MKDTILSARTQLQEAVEEPIITESYTYEVNIFKDLTKKGNGKKKNTEINRMNWDRRIDQTGPQWIELDQMTERKGLKLGQAQPQFGIEIGQGLIEQQQLRPVDDAARQRDPLHLAAR